MIVLKSFNKSYFKNYFDFSRNNISFNVENISFTIADGQIAGLLGPNGSGKTTIMKGICGFHYPTLYENPTSHEIKDSQILVSDSKGNFFNIIENPQKAMELIGYVPEQSILPPELTVYAFLSYAAQLHKITGEEKEKAILKVIKDCSLEKVLHKKIKTLSKGYHQRVSFAQAIIHNPQNLILDEPISGLDPSQIIQMRTLIKALSKNKAILLSTHLLQEVYSLCDSVFILNNGKLVCSGTEKEIIAKTKTGNLEEAFISLTGDNENE